MSIASRYLNREIIATSVVVLIILLVVAVGGRFVGYLQQAALGKYSADALWLLVGLRLPEFLQLLLPFALFLGLLLSLGRLYAEQEMVVLFGGGTSLRRLLGWLAPLVLGLAGLVGWLSFALGPTSAQSMADLTTEQRNRQDFGSLTPGVFFSYAKGDRVTYADAVSADRKTLIEVFMAERQGSVDAITVRAEQATQYVDDQSGSRYLLLERGTRYEGQIGTPEYRVIRFGQLGQRIAQEPVRRRGDRVGAIPSAKLYADASPVANAEWHRRVSLPVFTLISALLAVGLARVKPRQGRFARILPAVGVFVSYYLMLTLAQNLLKNEQLAGWLGMWPVHLIYLGLLVWLLRRFGMPQHA
jgi:lipopolysaccharide export system permease protein